MLALVWPRLAPILAITILLGTIAASALAQTSDDPAALSKEARELYRVGKYAEALPLAERALKAAEEQHSRSDRAVVAPLQILGRLLGRLGRSAEAESALKRSLAILEALEPSHPDVAVSLDNLAGLYHAQGRYADAEPLLKRSLATREKVLPPNHPDIAVSLNYLARLYRALGRYADAEPLLKRSLAIVEKLGEDRDDVGIVLNNLASLYKEQGRYADAEPLLKRGLAILEKALGPHSPHVGTSLEALASLYLTLGRYADAEPLLKRSLDILEKALGPDGPQVGTSLNTSASVYHAQGRYADAEPLFKRSLAIRQKALEPDHLLIGVSLNNLAKLYRSQGRYSDAEPLLKRGLAITEKALEPDHPLVSLITGDLGSFLKSEGRLDEAEPLLKRALDAGKKALGPEHPQVIRAAIQLAELYGMQGRVPEARELFAEAGASKAIDLKQFPIYFGTNRKRDPNQKRIAFGSERDLGELTLGVVTVVVPPPTPPLSTGKRGGGNAEEPELRLSDVRQLAIQPPELETADQIARAARERLARARTYLGQALVYVHGYNTSFDNAIRRAGQLAYDLNFDGPVFAFSWPSRERLLSYIGDGKAARFSAPSLREFLKSVVAQTNAKRIHIIAHSMGNEVLNLALGNIDPQTLEKLNFGEIVLASPDLDPDDFQQKFLPLQKLGATSTVYAASSDWALWTSSVLSDSPPLGYIPAGGPRRLVAGIDLIDITSVNSDVFSLNHDIYANSPAVIADLKRLLKEGERPPDTRTPELEKVPAAGTIYWRYKAPGSRP
jgi:esterase/lipase superfamily enzyme/Tfp pilus assembly protein PilF